MKRWFSSDKVVQVRVEYAVLCEASEASVLCVSLSLKCSQWKPYKAQKLCHFGGESCVLSNRR